MALNNQFAHADRNAALDGIRGVGALIVVFWHISVNFFPCVAWGIAQPTSFSWEHAFYTSPFWILVSGSFAVNLFFVMSGYVLTVGYFRNRKLQPLVHRAVGRPLRLGIPAAASTIALCMFFMFDPNAVADKHIPVLQATGSYAKLAPYLNVSPSVSLKELAANIFWLPWFQTPDFKRLYNGVLWTMYIELIGSFFAMGLSVVLAEVKSRWLASAGTVAVAFIILFALPGYGLYFAIFLVGTAIAVIDPPSVTSTNRRRTATIGLAVCGVVLGGYNGAGLSQFLTPVVVKVSSSIVSGSVLVMGVGAIMVFYSILRSRELATFFSRPAFVFLGRISFALYLFHLLVIFVVGVNLFSWLGNGVSVGVRSSVAASASLFGSIVVAAALARWVDDPAIGLARSVTRKITKDG